MYLYGMIMLKPKEIIWMIFCGLNIPQCLPFLIAGNLSIQFSIQTF